MILGPPALEGFTLEQQWSENAARTLAALRPRHAPQAVTWFNHYTLQATLDAGIGLAEFDYIGLDGIFLRSLVAPNMPRTSADLLLPKLFNHMDQGCRVGLVGSNALQLESARAVIEDWPTRPKVVLTIDGYSGITDEGVAVESIEAADLDVLILGLGAPLQDEWAIKLKGRCTNVGLIITCGGWIDQITQPTYYPRFAYKLRLNWLVRVVREPQRLWRRYTLQAVRAACARQRLRTALLHDGADGVKAMEQASSRASTSAAPPPP